MVDVSGIPNMGFGGGGYFGGIPNQQPAMSAAQINAGMWGNYSPQQAQATQAGIYGPGGFGAQPAYYAGLGAAYGRATGGFGTPGSNPGWQDPQPPDSSPWEGTGFDPIQYLQNNPDVAAAYGNDPMGAYTHATTFGQREGRGGTGMLPPIIVNEPGPQSFNDRWGNTPYVAGSGYALPNMITQGYNQTPQAANFNNRFSASPGGGGEPNYTAFGMFGNQPNLNALYGFGGAPGGGGLGGTDIGGRSRSPGQRPMDYEASPTSQTDTGMLFDSIKYLQNNPDVFKAGMSGYEHYDKFGRGEGREAAWGNVFDPNTYLRMNQDVQQAGMDPRTHWLKYGQSEGRQGGGVLNNTRDEIAQLLTGASHPSANPSYFNPGSYAGDQNNYGLGFNPAGVPQAPAWGMPSGPGAQGMQGPGGRPYDTWNPMTGGNASVQQLVNQGAGLNMPSGFGGSTYADNRMYGAPASGYLGAQGANVQDPFSAYVNPRSLDAGGSFPADYRPGYYASPFAGNAPGS